MLRYTHTIQLIYTASIWGVAKNKICNAILLMQINNSFYIKRFRVKKKTVLLNVVFLETVEQMTPPVLT